MGKISVDNDKAFRVSLPGYDVKTATPEQCAVHSGFDYPKMEEDLVGYEEYTVPASPSVTTYNILAVDHNLGYKPMSQCFVEDVDGVFSSEFATLPYLVETFFGTYFTCYTTTTQFKIDLIIGDTMTGALMANKKFNFKWQCWIND